jgi:hypothetical protein
MNLLFVSILSLTSQADGYVYSHRQLPLHGTVHQKTLYGFFGKSAGDFSLDAIPLDSPPTNRGKSYFLDRGQDGPFYNFRHHIKHNSIWISTGATSLARIKNADRHLFDSTNKDRVAQGLKKYPYNEEFPWDFNQIYLGTLCQKYMEIYRDEFGAIQGNMPRQVVAFGSVPASDNSCMSYLLTKPKLQIEIWDTHFLWDEKIHRWKTKPSARFEKIGQWISDLDSSNFQKRATALVELEKLGDLAEPALKKMIKSNLSVETRKRAELLLEKLGEEDSQSERLGEEADNYEKIPSLFNEDFYFFLRARDYYFVTKSGKLYVAPARKEGEKSRKMKSLWDDTKRPIGAVIEDSDNDKVWLFAKDKNAGAKMALYFEMKDTIKTESFDPAKLRPVNVEGRAKTLLEYVPLIYAGANK